MKTIFDGQSFVLAESFRCKRLPCFKPEKKKGRKMCSGLMRFCSTIIANFEKELAEDEKKNS